MKTITFYNEKGGVGKSTFSIMYASWLKYKHNVNVAFLDLNCRAEQYRKDEENYKKFIEQWDKYKDKDIYPIITVLQKDIMKYREIGMGLMGNILWMDDNMNKGYNLSQYDIIIIDFPGATNCGEFSQFTKTPGYLSQINIICDRDPQTINATIQSGRITMRYNHEPIIILNQIQTFNSMTMIEAMAKRFITKGFKILPDIISYTDRIKTIDKTSIIRSTLEYPDWSDKSFSGSGDCGFDNLFIDVTKELEKKPDIKNTKKTDLSFVYSLEKTFQEKRQLTVSSFPEYQFPNEMFPKSRFKIKEEKTTEGNISQDTTKKKKMMVMPENNNKQE